MCQLFHYNDLASIFPRLCEWGISLVRDARFRIQRKNVEREFVLNTPKYSLVLWRSIYMSLIAYALSNL